MNRIFRAVMALAPDSPEFLAGWLEGRVRFAQARGHTIIRASTFPHASVGHAASEAAVVFCQVLAEGRQAPP